MIRRSLIKYIITLTILKNLSNKDANNLNKQTYNSSIQEVEIVKKSGVNYIDGLFTNFRDLYPGPRRWKTDPYLHDNFAVNDSIVISYSIGDESSLYSPNYFIDTDDINENYSPSQTPTSFSLQQKEDIRTAFKDFENLINVKFIEIDDLNEKVGNIRLFISNPEIIMSDAVGGIPDIDKDGGDIIFHYDNKYKSFSKGLYKDDFGTFGPYTVLMHEIQHTLGIEHPLENLATDFPKSKTHQRYTIMIGEQDDLLDTKGRSNDGQRPYIDNNGTAWSVIHGPMVYDIAAIQYLYGANKSYNSDDSIYTFDPNIPFVQTIWDGGGIDTLDLSNFSKNNIININNGGYSSFEFDINWSMDNHLGIAFSANIENVTGGSGDDTIIGNNLNNTLIGGTGNDTFSADKGNDLINGGIGTDTVILTGDYQDYLFTGKKDNFLTYDTRTSLNEGIDSLINIELLVFNDQKISTSNINFKPQQEVNNLTSNVIYETFNGSTSIKKGATLYEVLPNSNRRFYSGNFDSYKFRLAHAINKSNVEIVNRTSNNKDYYEIILPDGSLNLRGSFYSPGHSDDLTGYNEIVFMGDNESIDDDKTITFDRDIKGVFDQVTGLNTDSGEMFRLYNAAFARFPDADGLKYWIDQFSSGRNTRRVVAQSFLGSAEFTEKYGSNVSDETYVNNLYKNVLGRDADAEGLNYWVGNLSSGLETRYEALLGFAESAENKSLFTDMTGFS